MDILPILQYLFVKYVHPPVLLVIHLRPIVNLVKLVFIYTTKLVVWHPVQLDTLVMHLIILVNYAIIRSALLAVIHQLIVLFLAMMAVRHVTQAVNVVLVLMVSILLMDNALIVIIHNVQHAKIMRLIVCFPVIKIVKLVILLVFVQVVM